MATVFVAAAINTFLLLPAGADAARAVIMVNGAITLAAIAASTVISRHRRRSPLLPLLAVLVMVDVGAVGLGLAYPEMHLISFGYVLLLPAAVALVIPWSTRAHGRWLVLHMALSVAYVLIARASAPLEVRTELALLVVSTALSLYGHFAGNHARVTSFLSIQRINSLERQTRGDQTRLAGLNAILNRTARTDLLTGLKNRVSLGPDMAAVRSRVERHRERFVLLMADLDRFKAINDRNGHLAGDQVLRAVAARLTASTRPEDGLYRFGGEEFLLLIRCNRGRVAHDIAERIRRAVESLDLPHPANPPSQRVTISVGAFMIGPAELQLDDAEWLRRADEALYRAKADGRNQSAVWDEGGSLEREMVRDDSAAPATR